MEITQLFHEINQREIELAHLHSILESSVSEEWKRDLDKYYDVFYGSSKVDQTKNLHNDGNQRHRFVRGVRHMQVR